MKNKKYPDIKALVLDIDGVLTDGTVNVSGHVAKRIFLRDLDAITFAKKKGIKIAFLTGEAESDAYVVVKRFGGGPALYNAKDKRSGIKEISELLSVGLSGICYIGDGRRDIPPLKMVGLGLCPSDGDKLAKKVADRVLDSSGGRGVVVEAVDLILGESDYEG